MLSEQWVKEAESLNFRQDRERDCVICDDPEIWIENCRGSWQENAKFVLVYSGARIGFAEPASAAELRAEIIEADLEVERSGGDLAETRRKTWVVGQLGVRITRLDIDKGVFVEAAAPYKFNSINEQNRAVAVIQAALAKHHDFYTDRDSEISRVIFARSLIVEMKSGALLTRGAASD